MMGTLLLQVCVLILLGEITVGQTPQLSCPTHLGWNSFKDKCYKKFVYPKLTRWEATTACKDNGATLLSVNSEAEHNYIDMWLRKDDSRRDEWLTSGITTKYGYVFWNGDGTPESTFNAWDIPLAERKIDNLNVVYNNTDLRYRWRTRPKVTRSSFICEISATEIYKLEGERRDFDYGLNVDNPGQAPRGPQFLQEPETTVILGRSSKVFFDCVASGNPEPAYEWVVIDANGREKFLPNDPRYGQTAGRLIITNPTENDESEFQCKASNEYGMILSATAELRFGVLGNFSNVPSAAVNGREHEGVNIECPVINGKPQKTYAWFKNSVMTFVRPNAQKHIFISANGKLYFSELAISDQAVYHCMVSLTSFDSSGNYVGSSQISSRTSLGFRLNVQRGTAIQMPPIIQNDFIYIYPRTPERGAMVRLECFAYGTGPLSYKWRRIGAEMPAKHTLDSNNRILILPDIQMIDEGRYECTVKSARTGGEDKRQADLIIQSKPYFTYPLVNQHVDIGSHVTLHCEAGGRPRPSYIWFKNGEQLGNSEGVRVVGNTLIIDKVNKGRDNGMYQCGAINSHGTAFSSAQVRVIELAPSFEKNPMPEFMLSSIGGDVTIPCQPVSAPRPIYTWLKDGMDLGLRQGIFGEADHVRMRLNGDLYIEDIVPSDQGRYTCRVENILDSAEDSTRLRVMDQAMLTKKPFDDRVAVNQSLTLQCEASHPPNIDMIYQWSFFDHIIDYDKEPQYRLGSGPYRGALNIPFARFEYEGMYTCTAMTSVDKFSASAYVTVLGPPSEPAGVFVRPLPLVADLDAIGPDGNISPDTRWLVWTDGDDHETPITHYSIDFRTDFDQTWRRHPDAVYITKAQAQVQDYPTKRTFKLTKLKAGVGVSFRVTAYNGFGMGTPSLPSTIVQINETKPTAIVQNIRGGGGSVGDLTILWDPLPREDHNSKTFQYVVEWRLRESGAQANSAKWRKKEVNHYDVCKHIPDFKTGLIYVCSYVTQVGPENYYTEYEARVTGKNPKGDGPPSPVSIIMSAEKMPLGAPVNVQARTYNATALMITWIPLPNDKKNAGGKLKGYKINYWRMNFDVETQALQNIIELKKGETNMKQALIIGLEPVLWYTFNVQAYNSAGNGPKSSDYSMQTLNRVPSQYPTEVHVFSVEGVGVRVNFRGISTQIREEPLQGYKVQYWKANENIRSAKEADFGKLSTGVIRNISLDDLYQLRVYGYSRGGQGKRSSPSVYFTVRQGEITNIMINQETEEIMGGVGAVRPDFITFTVAACVIFIVWLEERLH